MKFKKLLTLTALFLSTTILFGCAKKDEFNPSFKDKGQKIYLYGELHGNSKIYDEELKVIEKHYNEGIRDMFIEGSFARGEFLNIWINEKDDKILDDLMKDADGTHGGNEQTREFYLTIKKKFPELRFHGTDIEHVQTSYRYGLFLDEKNINDEFSRKFIADNREQKRIFKEERNYGYREEKMVENFKRQYEKLGNKSIIGFYGSAHIDLSKGNTYRERINSYIMAEELKKIYGDNLSLVDLSRMNFTIGKEKVIANGKEYNAKVFETINVKMNESSYIAESWELEDAYEDFKNFELDKEKGVVERYGNILFEKNKVYKFKIQYEKSEEITFYRTDEEMKNGKLKAYPIKGVSN